MTSDIEPIFNYFWLLAIAINALNSVIYWFRAQADIKANPDLKPGYIRMIRGFFVWMSVPWVIMGLGLTVGGLDSIADYLLPAPVKSVWVGGWWAAIWGLYLYFGYWLWFKGGAETLFKYPAFLQWRSFNAQQMTPQFLRWNWLVVLVAGGLANVVALVLAS